MYIWYFLENYPHKLVGEYDRKNSPDRFLFRQSKILNLEKTPQVIFEVKKDRILKFHNIEHNGGGSFKIVSPELAAVLEKYAKDDIQLIDVILKTKNGDITNYKILHMIKEIEAIDKEKTQIEYSPNEVMLRLNNLKLLHNKMKDTNIALLSEIKGFILISELLKEKIEYFKGVSILSEDEMEY